MRRSYESPLPLQEGWSSLQTHSRARRDTHRGLALVSGRLGNLHARTSLRVCSKNLQIAPNCGSWASSPCLLSPCLLPPCLLPPCLLPSIFTWVLRVCVIPRKSLWVVASATT